MSAIRPRRSCLYMPGSNARALEKAKTLAADVLIFDLEDAVAPDAKDNARKMTAEAVSASGYGAREVIIRINALDTEWGEADLAAAIKAGPDGILVPKVESAADIQAIEQKLEAAGAAKSLSLWAMIEMPLAILNIHEIAATAKATRLTGFVMGLNDLAKEYRATITPDRAAFQTALSMTLTAARAYGLVAIDGVFNNLNDEDGLKHECEQGKVMGFDGKTLIHPSQLGICNRIFFPDPAEVAHAREIIAAFALPENAGKGVLTIKGQMTELLHLEQAKQLVQIADMVSKT